MLAAILVASAVSCVTGGQYHITKIVQGSRIGDMISYARFDKTQAWEGFRNMVQSRVKGGDLAADTGDALIERYENDINRYTYLE